jgi:chromosome partitioning protein
VRETKPNKMRIIAIVNHKGGVGKTTTTLNLGKALSLQGKKVLLIDLDPQANLSQSVGIDDPKENIYHALCENIKLPITLITENFFICPADLGLSGAEAKLQSEQVMGYFKLKNLLPNSQDFDFVLIDCPPSLGILTINALLAANEVIIVTEPQFLAIKGLQTIFELMEKLKSTLTPKLQLKGILFTLYDRTVVSKSIIEQLQTQYGKLVFESIIRQNVKIAEASALRKDIFTYQGDSTGAQDYAQLAKEIII